MICGKESSKTRILYQYKYGSLLHPYTMNIGVEFFTKDFKIDYFNANLVFFAPDNQLFDSLLATSFEETTNARIS